MTPTQHDTRSPARRRRRRYSPLVPRLAFLALFFCGFLLGRATVLAPSPAPSPTVQVSPVPPVEPLPPATATPEPSPAPPEAESWSLILVNPENPLPQDFTVPKLTALKSGHSIDSRAYPALQDMMDDARSAGYSPVICSSYRTWEKQEELFERKVEYYLDRGFSRDEAEERAAAWVSPPGTSEHQAGLAVDIVDLDYQLLDEGQEDRPVQQWLMEHCWEYGFILRYPTEKSDLTGVEYEPWHYRYVGVDAAREIMEGGLCLEEYLEGQ